jgi:Pro-kumamolisin, activation domain
MTKRAVAGWLSGIALLTLAIAPNVGARALAETSSPRVLPGHVPEIVANGEAIRLGQHSAIALLPIAVSLPLRNTAALNSFLASVSDPSSPNYHHYLTQDQANAQFMPTASSVQRVVDWLRGMGLTVTNTHPNRLLIDAIGTAASINRAFHITINDYHAKIRGTDRTFYAPAENPTLDATVGTLISSVVGLDNVPRFHLAPIVQSNGSSHGTPAYYPQDFANAYNLNSLWSAGATGAGQHIGITLWTVPPSDTTLNSFKSRTGAAVATVANGKLRVIKVDGGTTLTASPDSGEAGMDIEYSGAMAPNATIDYYEAPTDSQGNPTNNGLVDALNLAGSDGNNNLQITNSWGECEPTSTSDSFLAAAESVFTANAATGHTYFFSSGDSGSSCDGVTAGHFQLWPDYPADSPHVVSVGGTKFNANVGSSWPGEAAWAYTGGISPEGSGGGYSSLFSRPSWETGSGLAPGNKRAYPDVSADSDPNTGAYVCYGSSSSCDQFGGTSLASPLWAGMVAATNQYLSLQGDPSAGFIAPTLFTLANQTQPYSAFHDVTSGTNGAYNAGPGWDAVTGWGSINAYNFARDLANLSSPLPTPTPTNTSTPVNTPTNTPVPTVTNTPGPTATNTPLPTATNTPLPTATNTALPTATNTPLPTATNTPVPSATNTALPTATNTPGPTSTNTPTPTPTRTPVPTATKTPTGTTPQQLVANGGFETSQAPWVEYSRGGYQIIDPTRPHTGRYSAWLCGYLSCDDRISQNVNIPSSFTKATLSYWLYVQSGSSSCVDNFTSRLKTLAGSILATTNSLCNTSTTSNVWINETTDVTSALSTVKGQTASLVFEGTSSSTTASNFFVDDVTLTVSQ